MRNLLSVVILATCALPGAAKAEPTKNDIAVISPGGARNELRLTIDGDLNNLSILQSSPDEASAANTMMVSITGSRNGHGISADHLSAPLIDGLSWGSLTQKGEGNQMDWAVSGSDNLLAAVQQGNANSLQASIVGSSNLAAISQAGNNNVAAFSQTGNGNIMSITQTAW